MYHLNWSLSEICIKINGYHTYWWYVRVGAVKSNEKLEKWPKFCMDLCCFNAGISMEYAYLLDAGEICEIWLKFKGFVDTDVCVCKCLRMEDMKCIKSIFIMDHIGYCSFSDLESVGYLQLSSPTDSSSWGFWDTIDVCTMHKITVLINYLIFLIFFFISVCHMYSLWYILKILLANSVCGPWWSQ